MPPAMKSDGVPLVVPVAAAVVPVVAGVVAYRLLSSPASLPLRYRTFLEEERTERERQQSEEWPCVLVDRCEQRSSRPATKPKVRSADAQFLLEEVTREELMIEAGMRDSDEEKAADFAAVEAGEVEDSDGEEEEEKEEEEEGGGAEGSFIPRQCDQEVDELAEKMDGLQKSATEVESLAVYSLQTAIACGEKYSAIQSYLTGMPATVDRAKLLDEQAETSETDIQSAVFGSRWSLNGFIGEGNDQKRALEADGALFLVRSTVPDQPYAQVTDGYAGHVQSPYNSSREAGGCSAGDAVLVATGVVNAALALDVTGSAKLAAASCGTCVLVPTRTVDTQHVHIYDARPSPMALSASKLEEAVGRLTRLGYTGSKPRKEGSLRVGILATNGVFPPAPVMARALDEVRGALEATSAVVIEVAPEQLTDFWRLTELSMKRQRGLADTQVLPLEVAPEVSAWRKLLARAGAAARQMVGGRATNAAALWATHAATTPEELLEVEAELEEMRKQFEIKFISLALDALVMPAFGTMPLARSLTEGRQHSVYDSAVPLADSYSLAIDALGLPVGVMPVTMSTEADAILKRQPENAFEKAARENEEDSANLPVAIQVIGLEGTDPVILSLMSELEAQLNLTAPRLLWEYRLKEFFGKPDAFACVSSRAFIDQVTDDII